MQAFVDDLDRSGERHSPKKFEDFRGVLAEMERHPNRDYFILKSLVVRNLFGVDIMEEAVEICKLRLFLKLVSQVERVEQLEPLPDIDFNIRPGNTLVGYATLNQVRKTLAGTLGFDKEGVDDIVEEAEVVDRAFRLFHEMQTQHGMDGQVFASAKQQLRVRLTKLSEKLDRFLAGEFGVDPDKKPVKFKEWCDSHEPFHWFAEFFGIMNDGGFSVIIGNPPYVELKSVAGYEPRGYQCAACGNLYALVLERCAEIVRSTGYQGFIVPVSSVSTDRYEVLQNALSRKALWFSSFDDRPSRLFDGLEHIRLTIHIIGSMPQPAPMFSSRYNKWNALERSVLFEQLALVESRPTLVTCSLPKLCSPIEHSILSKLLKQGRSLSDAYATRGEHQVFYSRKVGYFLQVLNFEPEVLDGRGVRRPPSEFKTLLFGTADHSWGALCCLNSSLFYWFVTVFSDCRHVNKREVDAYPIDLPKLSASSARPRLQKLGSKLMADLKANSEIRKMRFSHDELTVQCIIPKASKGIIDEIDSVLSEYYGLTEFERDFVVNYDIKYRMGQEGSNEEEE